MSGVAPVQVPLPAVSVCPFEGVPAIVGGAVLTGATFGAAVTVAVVAEAWVAVPVVSVALTLERSVFETSAEPTVYVWDVAPMMSAHAVESGLQRCHWNA